MEAVDNKSDVSSNEEHMNKNIENEEIDWRELAEKYDDLSYKSYERNIDNENKQSFESYTSKNFH